VNLEKREAPNLKKQITNKFQLSMPNYQNFFDIDLLAVVFYL